MARPCKKKRICAVPSSLHFGPDSETTSCEAPILMALDEYECIRLIDYEGLAQCRWMPPVPRSRPFTAAQGASSRNAS